MLEYRRVRAGQEIRQDRRALPGRHPAPAALEQNCRNLLKEDYASLFRAAPDGSHETSTGPKHASNLTGRGGAINHLHQAEGGQCNVKLARGRRYLLGTSLQKGDVAQAQPGRLSPRKAQHFETDIHGGDVPAGRDQGGRPNRYRARSGAEIADQAAMPPAG